MITKRDLDEAILECEGKRNPDSNTCVKLAAFYTIRNHMFPTEEAVQPERGYSYSAGGDIEYSSDSEFAQAIQGKTQEEVFSILDELMETVKVLNPRLYAGVMRRLQ